MRTHLESNPNLFRDKWLGDIFPDQELRLAESIRAADSSALDGDPERVAREFVSQIALSAKVSVDFEHPEMDEPREILIDTGNGFRHPVPFARIHLKVNGDASLLRLRPLAGPLNYPRARVHNGEITFEYQGREGQALKRQFDIDKQTVENGLAGMLAQIDQQNKKLHSIALSAIARRKAEVARQRSQAESIGIPIRHRE